jgi:hypothetical protein
MGHFIHVQTIPLHSHVISGSLVGKRPRGSYSTAMAASIELMVEAGHCTKCVATSTKLAMAATVMCVWGGNEISCSQQK